MPAWLGPALTGVAGAIGGLFTNRSNRNQAREQMRFQERMSSTAAQRSAEDYRRAGFNPALAYDRPASSPGGSSAQMDDFVSKGVNTALNARMQKEQIAQLNEQKELMKAQKLGIGAEMQLKGEQVDKTRAEADLIRALAPYQVQNQKAAARLQELGIPAMEAEAGLWKRLDSAGPVVKALAPFMRLLRPR